VNEVDVRNGIVPLKVLGLKQNVNILVEAHKKTLYYYTTLKEAILIKEVFLYVQ
jgi:hypothetical protein